MACLAQLWRTFLRIKAWFHVILIILSFNKQTNMSRLRPFAYSTGVGRPHDTTSHSIQPSSSGTGTLAKQLQQIESDIHPLSTIVNFISKESIDGSVQVRTRITGSFFIHFFIHSRQTRYRCCVGYQMIVTFLCRVVILGLVLSCVGTHTWISWL